ncbi:permease [Paraeggerthella hongkongensis]|nr:permease [Paraeggerthella hongkongensis]
MFEAINNALLKMTWLNDFFGWLLTQAGLDVEGRVGGSILFFCYDTVKIAILLVVVIFLISYIQSYFPPERTRRILGHMHGIWANIVGALMGTVTPFCSCSSIPLFIGFTKAGLPVGVTFSFLISSPMVDLASLILLASVFNWKIAIAYVVLGLVVAVVGGSLMDRMHLEGEIPAFVREGTLVETDEHKSALTRRNRIAYAWGQVGQIVGKVWPYVLIGVGVGALIHNWIPTEVIQAILGDNNPFSVILATLLGAPVYADIFGTLPIAEALVIKGVGVGTVVSFMMSVTVLSIPSLVMLKKVVSGKLMGIFIGVVIVGVVICGYALNAFGMFLV